MDVITSDFIYVIDYNYVLNQKLVYKVPVKTRRPAKRDEACYPGHLHRLLCRGSHYRFILAVADDAAPEAGAFCEKVRTGERRSGNPYRRRKDEVSVLISTIYDMARRLNDLIHYKYRMDLKQKEAQPQCCISRSTPTCCITPWKASIGRARWRAIPSPPR